MHVETIKDLDSLSITNHFTIKLDNKLIVYRKSNESLLSVIIKTDKHSFRTSNVIDISGFILNILEKKYFSDGLNKRNNLIDYNMKEILFTSIEGITINFIEYLRKNKLYVKFIYFNFNPSVTNAFQYKKNKQELASVILYNNKNENDKFTEYKDTMLLHKSTIKEKELCIDFDKKSFQPCEKRIFIKKFNNLKSNLFKMKSLIKYYTSNFFIEKYFLSKNFMIHYLFNNIFLENSNNTSQNNNQENFKFLIDEENDLVLLSILDIYDKSQKLFSLGGKNQDYADIVNYIEINLIKSNILLMKNKLIIIKYKCLFISLQLEIYDDKNILSNILSNNSFFSEIENLFSLCHNMMFTTGT